MSFIASWCRSMQAVPKRVFFLAVVFAVSSVYVSQEVGFVLAQEAMVNPPPPPSQPPSGENFQGPPPSGDFRPPSGGHEGNTFSPPPGGDFRGQPQGQFQQGDQPGNFGQGPDQRMGRPMNGQPHMQGGPMGQPGQMGNPQMKQGQFGQPPMGGKQMQQGQFGGDRRMDGQKGGQQGRMGNPQQQNSEQFNEGDEDFEKQDAAQEAKRAEQGKKELARIKSSLKSFTKMTKKFSTRLAALKKQGVNVTEAETVLADAEKNFALVMNASSIEDDGVMESLQTLQESGQALQQADQKLQQWAQLPKIFKQAEARLKKSDATLAKVRKTGDSAIVAEYEQQIAAIRAGIQSAKQATDAEEAMDTLNDVYELFNEADLVTQKLEAVKNAKKAITSFKSFIKRQSRNKAQAEIVAEMSERVAELEQLAASRSADPEDVRALLSDIFEMQNEIQQSGSQNMEFQHSQGGGNSQFNFQMPSFGQ